MQAGRLRRRIKIQLPVEAQNDIGEPVTTWQDFATSVPAAIEPLTGRELFAAQQVQASVNSLIRIRWRRGLTELMRVVHTTIDDTVSPPETYSDVYDIEAVLPDQQTGRREIHLMCVKRGADGFRSDGIQEAGAAPAEAPSADSSLITVDSDIYTADAA